MENFNSEAYVQNEVKLLALIEENEVLRLIEKERVTRMFMVPAMWNRLINVKDFSKYDLSSLRVGISGAESMPTSLKHQIKEQFKDIEIWEVYGLSEGGKTYLKARKPPRSRCP